MRSANLYPCSIRCFHLTTVDQQPCQMSQNVFGHQKSQPKPTVTPWNAPRRPIVFDCMIIRVGPCQLSYVRGACLFMASSVCAKKPLWVFNGSIIGRLVKASLKTSIVRSLLLRLSDLVICNNWYTINLHVKQCAVGREALNTPVHTVCRHCVAQARPSIARR